MYLSKGYKGIYDLYLINPLTGRRTKVTTGMAKKSDAVRFMRDFQIDDLNGKGKGRKSVAYLQELRVEILEYAKTNFAPRTYELYKMCMNRLSDSFGNRPIAMLGMRDLERYKIDRSARVRKTSVNVELRTIKAILNYCVKNGYIKLSPASGVKQFIIPEKERLSFSNKEVNTLLESIPEKLIRNFVMFALYTGCRLSEIINIQTKDIDLVANTLIIRNKADFKTKTGKIRRIPISKNLMKLLQDIEMKESDDYIFSHPNSNRLTRDFVTHKFKKYLRAAGFPEKFHFHCLRHTFITNLIKNGVPINFVKELAGHSDIQTTMNYIHIELSDLRNAVEMVKLVA